ncbi:MAG: type I restriction-modification system subunit M N-terminal domain-containing protein [Pirellulales bacterium]
MTEQAQRELGKTLWNIADTLRGAMNADDFRDYMLSFLFLRYLSDRGCSRRSTSAPTSWGASIPTATPSSARSSARSRGE